MSARRKRQSAVIYCRISRDPTGRELGVRRQEADCRAVCERHGYEIAEVFVDDDRSAYSGKPRPAFERMRTLLDSGNVDVVVAWHPDRLTRQPRELEDLIDLLERTATTVQTVQTGEYDLGTPAGRMSARIVGAVARHESEHKSARLRRKHVELAEAGAVSGGGDRPFGFEADRVTVHPGEAAIIREVVARALAGESLRSLARELNDRGVMTTAGRTWTPSKLRNVIASPRIAGLRAHRGEVVAQAVWPAIVAPDDFTRLSAILNDPARRKTPPGRERKLLTGLLRCGRCGESMVSRPRQDRVPTYVCAGPPSWTGCGRMRILAEPLETLVTAAVLEVLDTPALAEAMQPQADDAELLAELDALGQRREQLAAMWASGEIGAREWKAAGEALDARQTALERDLSAATTGTAMAATLSAGALGERWPALTSEQRRDVLGAVIERITIGPAVRGRNWFDSDRVAIEWRV